MTPGDQVAAGSMFLLGLLGSGHCLGMCGPLVVALPGRTGRFEAHLLYHLGRLSTYALVGALMGMLGGTPGLAGLAGLQVGLSLAAAVFLMLFGLNRLSILPEPAWLAAAAPQRLPGFGRALRLFQSGGGMLPLAALGAMLGLLPCGLSYAAFARVLATGSPAAAAALMACFGIGTLPALLLLGTGAGALFRRFRAWIETAAGLLMVGMGLSLFMRAIF